MTQDIDRDLLKRLKVGDAVPVRPVNGGIFTVGIERWHALLVRPQREAAVERWLHRHGVASFHPVRMIAGRRLGRAYTFARRYLPGYVFALFPGAALTDRVMTCPDVTDALRYRQTGSWGILAPQDLRDLWAMRRVDDEMERARLAALAAVRAARQLRAGDVAQVVSGPLAGLPGEVVTITAAGAATVRLTLLGRDMDITVDAMSLARPS